MLPLAKAVGAYSQAHNLQPRHPDIVLNRGIALAKLGKADEVSAVPAASLHGHPHCAHAAAPIGRQEGVQDGWGRAASSGCSVLTTGDLCGASLRGCTGDRVVAACGCDRPERPPAAGKPRGWIPEARTCAERGGGVHRHRHHSFHPSRCSAAAASPALPFSLHNVITADCTGSGCITMQVVLFRQAVELQPKDAKLHLTLGKALAGEPPPPQQPPAAAIAGLIRRAGRLR